MPTTPDLSGPDLPPDVSLAGDERPARDCDDAYRNGAYIPGAAQFPLRWAEAAAAFRAAHAPIVLPYGPGPRQALDLFMPAQPKGLCVFVHGGYWMAFGRNDWSHLAAGALAQGWAVALPGYTLAPEARISAITQDIARSIVAASGMILGPIRLAGHSAGGHLVTRMLSGALPEPVAARVVHVVSISGLHDLRPLLRTEMNQTLRLTTAEADAESPALLEPRAGSRVTAWVGAEERPEFLRQSALLANVWHGLGADTALVVEPSRHHFNVIDGLADPSSALTRCWLS